MSNEQLSKALDELKKSGVRMTSQRQAILEYLLSTKSHPSADGIYQAVKGKFPNMSVATVYNNLRFFKEKGIIDELKFGDASSRFDFNTQRHYHILCEGCNKIVDFHYPGLDVIEEAAARLSNFQITKHRLEIYGKCEDCAKASK